jgi:hypothetical protein
LSITKDLFAPRREMAPDIVYRLKG